MRGRVPAWKYREGMENGEFSKAELRLLGGPAQFQIAYVLEHNRELLHAAKAGLGEA